MNPEESNTLGQVLAILMIAGFCAVWVAIGVRREKVRDRQRMRRLAKVSGDGRTVGPTSDQDRSDV